MAEFDAVRTAKRWLAAEPDADIREELQALLDGDPAALAERFAGRLTFGTAGLRAGVGAGPLRMNRLVVRQAAAGLAAYLKASDPDAAARGVVIGYDARRKSDVFAQDTARVMAAAGVKAMLLPDPLPTPVLAWSITELDAAAGVMVTASHNPPADNGYKVYLGDGAQIVPPHDSAIADEIARVDPTDVALAEPDDASIITLDDGVTAAYLASIAESPPTPRRAGIRVAYTPLHGVGGETACTAFELAGFDRPVVVDEQFQPDGRFPTVSFPNPEEPGAMDLFLALADDVGAELAIANDPDADRLGAAIPQPDGSWRRLGGDEIGWLLADHILANTSGDDRLVITTLVSSSLLGDMAKSYGVHAKETYTGFKWIGRTILDNPGPALRVRLRAGARLPRRAAAARQGRHLGGADARRGGRCRRRRGHDAAGAARRHRRSLRPPRDDRQVGAHGARRRGRRRSSACRPRPPTEIGGARVVDVAAFPEADLLRFELAGGVRVQVRPSGTEPKVKIYGEAVNADPVPYVDALISLI